MLNNCNDVYDSYLNRRDVKQCPTVCYLGKCMSRKTENEVLEE
jgi:hypothetical protein